MLFNVAIASAALFGGLVRAQGFGSASVVNHCSYPVYLANTPSADGVHQTQSKTLQPGDSYTQTYTVLENLMGWSLKLAQDQSFPNDATFQFEYTVLGDAKVWFDMSNVNNQDWNFQHDIVSSNCDCNSQLKQISYAYSTDDTAMQSACNQDASVEVALCQAPGSGTCGDESPAPASSAESAPTSQAAPAAPAPAPATTEAAAPSAPAAPSSNPETPLAASFFDHNNVVQPAAATSSSAAPPPPPPSSAAPTTLTTSTQAAVLGENGAVETVWFTDVVIEHLTLTTTADPGATPLAKRHEHHAHGHAHH